MQTPFQPVDQLDALERLFDQSRERPVVIFKHDTACPISAAAHDQMTRVECDVCLVDVEQKDLSGEVERRTGVRHESPQVIVLRDGAPVWSASHFEIKADAVNEAARGAA